MDSWASGMALGPYLLLAPIAAGGMGEVWKARDTRLDRLVAIKRIKRPHSARFQQEARSIAALNHPQICCIYDVGPDYLVLEYIDGRRLPCPVPLEEALRFATQIARALSAAHRKKIIHRDLKPANIMVTVERNVKLLDFGLAKLIARTDSDETETMEGNILGTAAYMSPEQAEGKSVDERSDIFSFGAVLYEMIGGVRAFTGGSKAQVLSAVLRDDPPPLSAPPQIDRIVRRCLAKQPGRRFQTVDELLVALEHLSVTSCDPQPSIAVLPFSNLSADEDNQYFSDGLAEEIINALAHVPGLKVTARTSSFAFRDKQQDIRRIGEMLGVNTVLTGGIRRADNRIRVTAQLINAADGYHLWSDRYDRELADVFAIQDGIAQAISSALQVELAPQPRRPAVNFPAYEALLKGRHLLAKSATGESLARAKELIEQAIALDPKSALAHVELGTYFLHSAALGASPAPEALAQARSAARQALELDSSLPEAHALLAQVFCFLDHDWEHAGRHFALAQQRQPVPPHVRYCFAGSYLVPMGRLTEAADQLWRALQEDPLNGGYRFHLALCLSAAGKNEEAAGQFRHISDIDAQSPLALIVQSRRHLDSGNLADALSFAERAYSVAPENPTILGAYAAALWRHGSRDRAEELLHKLRRRKYGSAMGFWAFYSSCMELNNAAEWAARAIEERDPSVLPVVCGPARRAFEASGHWPALARLLNLPGTAAGSSGHSQSATT